MSKAVLARLLPELQHPVQHRAGSGRELEAARQVLEHLGLQDQMADRMVFAENVGQAHAMVDTGNADAGFLARAQVFGRPGSHWHVPSAMHAPIEQQAVLLERAADNAAATGFLAFLRSGGVAAPMTQFLPQSTRLVAWVSY